jgi:uncharacterized membrane protein YraQ (UPF0718 family)
MTHPTVVTDAAATMSKAFNWKNLLFLVIVTVIVTLIVSYIVKQEVILTDANGQLIGKGEIKPKLKVKISKTN